MSLRSTWGGSFILWSSWSFSPFLLRGFLSLELIVLPHFKCALDSFALIYFPVGTSTRIGALAVEIWDLVTLDGSMNASGSIFAIFYKWIILWTFSSHFVQESKLDSDNAFQSISFLAAYFLPLMLSIHQNNNKKYCCK